MVMVALQMQKLYKQLASPAVAENSRSYSVVCSMLTMAIPDATHNFGGFLVHSML